MVRSLKVLLSSLQTPVALVVICYRKLVAIARQVDFCMGLFLVVLGLHAAEKRQGLQSADVCLEDVAALLHAKEVLLDKRIGDVKLLEKNEVDYMVDHSLFLFAEFLPCVSAGCGASLFVNTCPRCDSRKHGCFGLVTRLLNRMSWEIHLNIFLLR